MDTKIEQHANLFHALYTLANSNNSCIDKSYVEEMLNNLMKDIDIPTLAEQAYNDIEAFERGDIEADVITDENRKTFIFGDDSRLYCVDGKYWSL